MTLQPRDIHDHLDGSLAVLLAALLLRRDLPEEFVHDPWRHTLGTLSRNNLALAIKRTESFGAASYRLHQRWDKHFAGETRVVDHVFPVNEWKKLLLDLSVRSRWSLNARSLSELRAFVVRHYVTAEIPASLHHALPPARMPNGWNYIDSQSIWARYKTPNVQKLMGRELRCPGQRDPDFVVH